MSTGPRRSPVRRGLLAALAFYSRAVSPALPPRCRFYPTCSAYAAEAIEVHGTARGVRLAVVRLLKCAPWHPGGVDPVPPSSGTGAAGHSSNAAAGSAVSPEDRAPRPATATPPAMRLVPQEESSVV